jgi:Fe-S cluster biosynthesis and repair protein YggX
MPETTCVRCGQTKPGFERPPFPGEAGQRIVAEICQDCWQQWTRQQMMLINHYGLNLMDPQARTFLTRQMEAFLFGKGQGEKVDTSKEGTIEW